MRNNVPGTIYLLHFDKPYKHARHYLGWTEGTVEDRVERHRSGNGSALMRAVTGAGIKWAVVRTWDGKTRNDERRMHQRGSRRYCDVCPPENKFTYATCCVDCPGPDAGDAISAMVETSNVVVYETLRRRCVGLTEWARSKGYVRDSRVGLTLEKDFAVTFHRSTFRGESCYYVLWSGIEYIWTATGDGEGWGYGSFNDDG